MLNFCSLFKSRLAILLEADRSLSSLVLIGTSRNACDASFLDSRMCPTCRCTRIGAPTAPLLPASLHYCICGHVMGPLIRTQILKSVWIYRRVFSNLPCIVTSSLVFIWFLVPVGSAYFAHNVVAGLIFVGHGIMLVLRKKHMSATVQS